MRNYCPHWLTPLLMYPRNRFLWALALRFTITSWPNGRALQWMCGMEETIIKGSCRREAAIWGRKPAIKQTVSWILYFQFMRSGMRRNRPDWIQYWHWWGKSNSNCCSTRDIQTTRKAAEGWNPWPSTVLLCRKRHIWVIKILWIIETSQFINIL